MVHLDIAGDRFFVADESPEHGNCSLGCSPESLMADSSSPRAHQPQPSRHDYRSTDGCACHVVQYTTLFAVAFFLVDVLAHKSIRRTAGLVLLTIPDRAGRPLATVSVPTLAKRRDWRLRRCCDAARSVSEVAYECHTSSIPASGDSPQHLLTINENIVGLHSA